MNFGRPAAATNAPVETIRYSERSGFMPLSAHIGGTHARRKARP